NATTKGSRRGSIGAYAAGIRNQSCSPANPRLRASTRADTTTSSPCRATAGSLRRQLATGQETGPQELHAQLPRVATLRIDMRGNERRIDVNINSQATR